MKKFLLTLTILGFGLVLKASVNITESGGWLESAYVLWDTIADVDSFNVYYSGEGYTDQIIDDQLIRKYGSYYRADIPGLAAGTYTIKIVPVTANGEGTATETGSISVKAHDRTGFAFSNSHVPGAYKADGTPKSNAVVLYITENTKNTVSLEVTGATSNPCVGLQTILDGFKKGKDNRPLIVRFVGQITDLDYMSKGDIVIENNNNSSGYITFEGIGDDAVADGWGIRVKNATNIEIRNIGLMNCDSDEGDNIGLQQGNEYIWVHNCDFFYGNAGSDSDQAKGDGALDCKKSTYVTFSYNHFWDSGKCNLLGLSEDTTDGLYITYHHNWYDHSDSRHPRVRFYSAHVYNNYYDGNSKYGVGSTEGSSVFVEGNYFRHCKYPMLTSMQGSDVYGDSDGTFSDEDGGTIKAYNNYMINQTRFVAYGDEDFSGSTTQFDAVVVTSRSNAVSSDIQSYQGSNTYNNFDIDDDVMYSYTAQEPAAAKDTVMKYAGRVNGGDFTWTFTNSTDDTSYDVDDDLKSALSNYTTSLTYIQGDGDATGNSSGGSDDSDDGSDSDSGTVIEGDEIHNFTESGKESTFYNITGNLSDSKGTVYYGDLTLTQCLKIESSTSITFTTTEESTLTLVFNDDFSDGIKIDDTSYDATSGILSMTLASGDHEITKDNTANLYYMSVKYSDDDTDDSSDTDDSADSDDSDDSGDTNDSDSTNTNSFIQYETTGEDVILYPNPVTDYLKISYSGTVSEINIYNITGTLVQRVSSETTAINMSNFDKGVYLVVIKNTDLKVFKELVIKQ